MILSKTRFFRGISERGVESIETCKSAKGCNSDNCRSRHHPLLVGLRRHSLLRSSKQRHSSITSKNSINWRKPNHRKSRKLETASLKEAKVTSCSGSELSKVASFKTIPNEGKITRETKANTLKVILMQLSPRMKHHNGTASNSRKPAVTRIPPELRHLLFKPYVASRIGEIQTLTNAEERRYTLRELNPIGAATPFSWLGKFQIPEAWTSVYVLSRLTEEM